MISARDLLPALALTFSLSALGGCGESEDAPAPIEAARAELAQGDGAAARIYLDRALDSGENRRNLAVMMGEAALLEEDFAAAREWLGPGEFSPESAAVGFRLLGRLEMAQGNLPAAGAAFDRSHRLAPEDAGLWVDIARLRYQGGEHVQAIAAVDRALAFEPAHAEALRFRGQLVRDAHGMEAGVTWLRQALDRWPDELEIRLDLAATLADAGHARRALAVLREAGGAAVDHPRGLFVQAVIAARGGELGVARDLLARSGLQQEAHPAAQMLGAILDLDHGNLASATLAFDRLYARQPDNSRIRDLFAYALARSGAERELVHRFAAVAQGGTGSPYLRLLVGRAFEALDDRARAASYLDRATAAETGLAVLPVRSPSAQFAMGDLGDGIALRDFVRHAIAIGDTSEAVRRARSFAARVPGSGDASAILGDAELANGDRAAARAAYARSARVRQSWPLIVRRLRAEEDAANARAILTRYLAANPLRADAALALAEALALEGEWDRAAALLDHALELGAARNPAALAARSIAARELGEAQIAFDYALAAHELQPMNPLAIGALLATLPADDAGTRAELEAKLASLRAR